MGWVPGNSLIFGIFIVFSVTPKISLMHTNILTIYKKHVLTSFPKISKIPQKGKFSWNFKTRDVSVSHILLGCNYSVILGGLITQSE